MVERVDEGVRNPSADESRLLKGLAELAGVEEPDAWLEALLVREMDDGGMGSLEFQTLKSIGPAPTGPITCRSVVQFTDADGVEVIASLNASADGEPFELDMWKTDFSRLIRIPHVFRGVEE